MDLVIKRCACSAEYTRAQWEALKYVGQTLEGEACEHRVCRRCGSTIAIGIKAKPRRAAKRMR